MEQASFNESISSGSLRTIADIKLLVCYLLKKLDKSMTRTQMCEVLQENDTANYFEANQAISELIKNGKLFCELSGEEELLSITPQVKYDVMQIESSLPKTLRERSVAAALRIISRDRIERESKVEVEKKETGYYVTFIIEDVGIELLRLKVYVSDLSQVELVKRNFYDKAVSIYSDIISSLTVE
ncbi:MAG: DUF4364 family protein [Acutalibacteraceae bacterium]